MNSASTPIIEEDLHAFVDNEIDDDKHEAVLAYLATAPADAARVETWRQQNILLRAAFAQVTLEPVPASLTFTPRLIPIPCFGPTRDARRYPSRLWRRSFAFSVAAFVAGISIALVANFSMSHYRDFLDAEFARTAAAPGSTVARVATEVLRGAPQLDTVSQSAWNLPGAVAPVLVILPALRQQGLQLVRGEIRGKPNAPIDCLDFADPTGAPVALCVAPARAPRDPSFEGLAVVSRDAVYWREAASYYALAAKLPNARLLALARRFHALLTAKIAP